MCCGRRGPSLLEDTGHVEAEIAPEGEQARTEQHKVPTAPPALGVPDLGPTATGAAGQSTSAARAIASVRAQSAHLSLALSRPIALGRSLRVVATGSLVVRFQES